MDSEARDKLWAQAHSYLNSGREDRATALFSQLAEDGDWRGPYMVGWIFEQKGKGERENYIVAAHWYSRALSIAECSPPHRALARYYYFGLGGYYDYRLAFEHLQKSEQDPVVKMMTAELLSRGLGVAENKKEARNLFRSAASSGYPAALMGLMLLEKSERNYISALVYFIRGLYAAIKLVVKNKHDPLLTGIGGKRGTIRRDWVVKQQGIKGRGSN